MTVPATSRRAGPYNGNGSTTTFSFSFKTFDADDLLVTRTASGVDTTLVKDSDYSVTLNGDQDANPGGSITYPISGSALASGQSITIIGDLPYEQTTDLLGGGAFNARVIEDTFDRTVVQIQQLKEVTDRALIAPIGLDADATLPYPEGGKVIGWNEAGDALQNYDASAFAAVVAYGTANADVFTGNGSTTAFTLSASPATINNLDIAIDGVTQYPTTDYTWSSGTTLTFTSAPANGAKILVRYAQALALGNADAASTQYLPAGTGAVATTVQSKLRETVSVLDFGAVGDGVTDDTAAFNATIASAIALGRAVFVPTPSVEYRITSTLQISQYCPFVGESAGLLSQYIGKQKGGSRIYYAGTGPCFQVNPNPSPGSSVRLAYGQQFQNLIIEGNSAASHGIKISDKTNINVAGMDLAGLQIENVFIYGFKTGRALEVNFCFNNSLKNFVAETCGVSVTLNYAHNTTFIGGSIEQCLVGLDSLNSYDVTLHGTCLQGLSSSRIASHSLAMPSDFFIWTGAWNGSGPQGVTRTLPVHYAGIGVRNFGSIVNWFGGYEEANEIGYLTELGSITGVYGKYIDLDAAVKYFAQFGIGAFACENCTFQQGNFGALVGVFHTERNYATPIRIQNPVFASTVPGAKKFTGITISASVGTVENFDPLTNKATQTLYGKDVVISGGLLTHSGLAASAGFNKEFRETLTPTSTGTLTKDFSVGTTSTNITHVINGATLTVTFDANAAARAIAGTPMRLTIINTTNPSTVTFSSTYFRTGSASYSLGTNKQRVFVFFFENGFWLEQGVDLSL